jgi:hypothetical protein
MSRNHISKLKNNNKIIIKIRFMKENHSIKKIYSLIYIFKNMLSLLNNCILSF